MAEHDKKEPEDQPGFIIGIILLMLGGVLLALNFGLNIPSHIWKYFPVLLIASGIWGLVHPTRHLDRVGGLWLLAAGVYCLISAFNLFGLSWFSAWPVYVIAMGFSVMIEDDSRRCFGRHSRSGG